MRLTGVTVYDRGLSMLSYEHELTTDGTASQQIQLTNIEGKLIEDKISVAFKEDYDSACFVVNSTLQTNTIAGGSWLESEGGRVKALYDEIVALMVARETEEQLLKHLKAREELIWKMVNNVVDPKTLAAKSTDILGASADRFVGRTAAILDDVREFETTGVGEKLRAQLKLAEIVEQIQAARANLQRETGGECGVFDEDEASLAKLGVEIRRPRTHTTHTLTVAISSQEIRQVTLCVNYLVHSTSWRSFYDFRLSGTRLEKCRVCSYVKISQNSGVDWRGVPIYVSNDDPTAPLAPAAPRKSFVDLAQQEVANAHPQMMRLAAAPALKGLMSARSVMAGDGFIPLAKECRECFGSLRIQLPEGTELTSRSAEHTIFLTDFELKGTLYHHIATAHKKDAAYRAVVIENDSKWTILNSESNTVHLNNHRVGDVQIDRPVGTGSSFVLYAGVDDLVQITDLGPKEFKSKAGSFIVGPTVQRDASGVQLEIKNSHPPDSTIEVLVTYSLPESQNQQVSVAAKSEAAKNGAKIVTAQHDCLAHTLAAGTDVINQATGSYIQKFKLQGGEQTKASFSYTIAYPEGSKIKSWTEAV